MSFADKDVYPFVLPHKFKSHLLCRKGKTAASIVLPNVPRMHNLALSREETENQSEKIV